MSYANGTTHYNLPQTVGTDKRDWFDSNQAFADIDAAIFGAVQTSSEVSTQLNALTGRVTDVEGDVTTLEGIVSNQGLKISTLEGTVGNHTNQIADVRQDAEDMICAYNEGSAQTSTHAYAVGDYFIYNDVLYRATAVIAIGDTIVPNTNCAATNVTTEINTLKTDLENKVTYITVAGDSQGSVMQKLDNLVDRSKLTEKSCMRVLNNVAQCSEAAFGQFINTSLAASHYSIVRYDLTNHNVLVWTTNATGSSLVDATTDAVPVGSVYEIWY